MKCVAIFLVVIYHFNSIPTDFIKNNSMLIYINYFFNTTWSTCVPIFFFVNGALLINKSFDLNKHIRKIIRIIILTFIWGMITFITLVLIHGEHLSRYEIISGILSWRQDHISYLWFLQAMVVIYIFFPLIKQCFDCNKKSFNFFMITIIAFTFGMVFLFMINFLVVLVFHKQYFNLVFSSLWVFSPVRGIYGYSLGYFMLGGLLFSIREKLRTKRYQIISIIAIPVSMLLWMGYGIAQSLQTEKIYDVAWFGYDSIFALIMVIAFFIISLNYKSRGIIGKLISIIGKNSLGIYLLHIIIGNIVRPLYSFPIINGNVLLNWILTLCLVLLSLGVCLLLKKVPVIKKLFSL